MNFFIVRQLSWGGKIPRAAVEKYTFKVLSRSWTSTLLTSSRLASEISSLNCLHSVDCKNFSIICCNSKFVFGLWHSVDLDFHWIGVSVQYVFVRRMTCRYFREWKWARLVRQEWQTKPNEDQVGHFQLQRNLSLIGLLILFVQHDAKLLLKQWRRRTATTLTSQNKHWTYIFIRLKKHLHICFSFFNLDNVFYK